jgi:hypothetical protein
MNKIVTMRLDCVLKRLNVTCFEQPKWSYKEKQNPHFDLLHLLHVNSNDIETWNDNLRDSQPLPPNQPDPTVQKPHFDLLQLLDVNSNDIET